MSRRCGRTTVGSVPPRLQLPEHTTAHSTSRRSTACASSPSTRVRQASNDYSDFPDETPDFWYRANIFNYINTTNPDVSGTFKFLIQELQCAEDAHERVWIIGHVLSGWDGTNPMPNPTNLFHQIVERYSPHVIAGVFFGHTHEDENMIWYANNGTQMTAETALTPGWIGPSVTPLTNLNSGFRMYEVDTGDFEVYDSYTFFANVSAFPALDKTSAGPTFYFEYSARQAYPIGWPDDAPLNATYWHKVTELMARNHTYVAFQNSVQGKRSALTPDCTSDECAEARICYFRSASQPLARRCTPGYGSVQSRFGSGGEG